MKDKIQMFLKEYDKLNQAYLDAKTTGNIEMVNTFKIKIDTLRWVLVELGCNQDVIDIDQRVWKG